MRISAKSEYAIKAMLDLAIQRERGLVPIQAIAGRRDIPQRYLEQVLLSLKRAGLVTSKRGSSGGYHLARSPEEITVGDVLRAVEGTSAPFEALTGSRPSDGHELGELWAEISDAVSKVVDRLTFAELARRVLARQADSRSIIYRI
jgi:Rrf2 family transcriptional regulator, cysteine metabolism repressor